MHVVLGQMTAYLVNWCSLWHCHCQVRGEKSEENCVTMPEFQYAGAESEVGNASAMPAGLLAGDIPASCVALDEDVGVKAAQM